jgi:hypothetical protein
METQISDVIIVSSPTTVPTDVVYFMLMNPKAWSRKKAEAIFYLIVSLLLWQRQPVISK